MKQQIFIGSSGEGADVADAIQANLDGEFEATVWNQGIFNLTEPTLKGLLDTLDRCDAAVYVATPDDLTTSRGTAERTVRDNVLLELGMSLGKLAPERTFLVAPREDLHLPTDLLGITVGRYYPDRSDENLRAALDPVCAMIARRLRKVGPRRIATPFDDSMLPDLRKFHDAVGQRLEDILQDAGRARRSASKRQDEPFVSKLRSGKLHVEFGRIEKCDVSGDGAVVALPANEFFDDECFNDRRSALGAYFFEAFGESRSKVRSLLAQDLRRTPPAAVERKPGQFDDSYGVGRCIYLNRPLGLDLRVILVSTTTMRADEGLKAEPHFLFAAIRAIAATMSANRLDTLYVPLLGSGHGVLSKDLALLYMILGFRIAVEETAGRHLTSVHIVVYQRDPESAPDLSADRMRAILSLAGVPA